MSTSEPRATHEASRADVVAGERDDSREALVEAHRAGLASAVLGAVMVVLGVVTLVQAVRLDNEDQVVGPATAPYLVGALTFLVGALLVVRGRRDATLAGAVASSGETRQDWLRMGALVVVLVVFALVVPLVGYVVGATALFGVTAVVLGMPERVRAFVVGFSVAALVFLAFDVGIGIALPAGPWGF